MPQETVELCLETGSMHHMAVVGGRGRMLACSKSLFLRLDCRYKSPPSCGRSPAALMMLSLFTATTAADAAALVAQLLLYVQPDNKRR